MAAGLFRLHALRRPLPDGRLCVLVNALDQIGPAAEHIQPLFITIDPERDRGALLRDFTRSFDNRLVGLSGTVAQIRDAADALGVSFRKVAQGNADYAIDHSSSYTLVDPARTWTVERDGTLYLNAARVPRVFKDAGREKRHVVELIVDGDAVTVKEVLFDG